MSGKRHMPGLAIPGDDVGIFDDKFLQLGQLDVFGVPDGLVRNK
jgi:hypothetical protein